jgi:type I restriction enzyme S subunit
MLIKLCPEGVAFMRVDEVCVRHSGLPLTAGQMREIHITNGDVRIFAGGQTIADVRAEDFKGQFIEGPGLIVKSRGYIDFEYWNGRYSHKNELWSYKPKSALIDLKFLYYFLKTKILEVQLVAKANSVKMPQIKVGDIDGMSIPIPPLEVQQEIVRILDKFTELESELEAELEARVIQRNFVINELHNGELPRLKNAIQMPLEELVHFENGKPHEQLVDPEGDCELITAKFIASNGTLARRINRSDVKTFARVNDITMVLSDLPNGKALAKCFFIQRGDFFGVNQRIAILRAKDETKTSAEYLYHFVNRNPQILKFDDGSTQTHLKKANVLNTIVYLPDIESQRKIASELSALDKFVFSNSESLPAEIEARRKQYEYYRRKLLSFTKLGVI